MKTVTFLQWRLKFTALLLFSMSINLSGQEAKIQKDHYGQKANEIVPGARFVQDGMDNEYPASVKFSTESEIEISKFVPWLKSTFEMGSDIDFTLIDSKADELGFLQQKYIQTYKGIPIDRADYVVQSLDGNISSFRGDAYNIENVSITASINEKSALKYALEYMGDLNYRWNSDFWESEIKEHENNPNASYYPIGELILTKFGNSNEITPVNEFKLAYRFDIYAEENEEQVIIDAETGEVIYTLALSSNCEPEVAFTSVFNGSQNIKTDEYTGDPDYRLKDDCQTTDVWVRDWNSATNVSDPIEIDNTDNSWTNMDERFGATVLWETKESYNYFKNVHSRSSYDGANGDVTCYINATFRRSNGTLYTDNATMAFNGSQMKVGLGSSGTLANSWSSIDIIAHEFTHAVTGTSSGLVYQGESGALNESFSDIFGEMVENYVAGPNDWLMGDDRTSGAIRSMEDPKSEGDPDTYNGANWANTCNGCGDAGGVHSNSGIQNYWFFLLVEGGSGTNDNGDDYVVNGIGISDASAITFRNQTIKLTTGSQYIDARSGAIEAAEDLYGICSFEVKAVTNAWYAVGVGDPYVDVNVVSNSDISCFGFADGSITIAAVGTDPLSYEWNDGITTQNRSDLSSGNYSVTVTDATGCTSFLSQLISEPNELLVLAMATSDYNGFNISCNGLSDGVAEAAVSGGTGTYTYQWDANAGNQMTAIATNLSVGTYWIEVSDENACSTSTMVTLTEPDLLEAAINDVSDYNGFNISCNGGSDGTATVSGTNGVEPYSYYWSDGQTTQTANNLMAGTFGVIITDANGCLALATVTLTEPTLLNAAISDVSNYKGFNISCNGGNDGWATVNGTGGVAPYTYNWSDGQTTQTAIDLMAGTYIVIVIDANQCEVETMVSLTEPSPLNASISNVSIYNGFNISCNGGSDGWATVSGNGGVGSYTYQWDVNAGNQTTATASNLMAGAYWVTITDENDCEAETMVTLTEPTPLTIEAGDNQTVYFGYPPAECADINWSGAGGGVPPYAITWSDGGLQTHEVCPGDITSYYTVTITDANGCVETDEVTICVIDVRCGNKLDKVEMCHVPEEDPENVQTICVSINSVETHLLHGDLLAACGTDHSCPPVKSNESLSFASDNNSIRAYPNPFNQNTSIEFLSTIDGNVTMKLYDISGKEIAVLFNATVKAKELNTVKLNQNLVRPGLNICLIQYADGSTEAIKLIFNQ